MAAYTFKNIAASATDSEVVPAVSSRVIRVHGVIHQCGSTATNITWNSKGSGAGTSISMQFQNGANGGAVLSPNDIGYFQTNSGEALTATTGTGSTTGVQVIYSYMVA